MSDVEFAPVRYDQFLQDVDALAAAIAADGWCPDHLVAIGRGGLVPGVYLSHRTGIPLLPLDRGAGAGPFGGLLVPALASIARDGSRLLLVDDINDSGRTIAALLAALVAAGAPEARLRTAVLIDNLASGVRVNYRARTIDRASDARWFVFPWEQLAPPETIAVDAERHG